MQVVVRIKVKLSYIDYTFWHEVMQKTLNDSRQLSNAETTEGASLQMQYSPYILTYNP